MQLITLANLTFWDFEVRTRRRRSSVKANQWKHANFWLEDWRIVDGGDDDQDGDNEDGDDEDDDDVHIILKWYVNHHTMLRSFKAVDYDQNFNCAKSHGIQFRAVNHPSTSANQNVAFIISCKN